MLSLELGDSVSPDNYNGLLEKYDRLFMEKMGIENDFCIYHVLHWILMDSGMDYVCFVEPDRKRDKSKVYGSRINQDKIRDNLKKYELVLYEKVKKMLCSK